MPITERKRRMTMWDIKPQGYENVTSEQAKLSGSSLAPSPPSLLNQLRLLIYLSRRHVPTPWCSKTGSYGSD